MNGRFVGLLTALLMGLALIGAASPATAGAVGRTGDLTVQDRQGDGQADIVRMTVRHSNTAAAVVRVKVRGVRRGISNELLLFVDPTGKRVRPSYVVALGIDNDGEYSVRYTHGWRLLRRTFTCGESLRVFYPSRTVRVVQVRMPYACFGDYGARFAAKTQRWDSVGKLPNPDWAPRTRALSRLFRL